MSNHNHVRIHAVSASGPADPGVRAFVSSGEREPMTMSRGYTQASMNEEKTIDPRRRLTRGRSRHHIANQNRSERMIKTKAIKSRQNLVGNLLAVVEEYGIRRKKTDFHAHSTFPVFVPTNSFRQNWDKFTMIVLLYVIFVTPFSIAFLDPPDPVVNGFDRFVDAVFWVDIVLNFRTAWVDVEGHMCFEWKECARSYAKGWLFTDVVSCLPYDLMAGQKSNDVNSVSYAKSLMILRAL